MNFERSENWGLIKAIATHPKVWDAISDDFTAAKEVWEPVRHESVWYVVVKDDCEVLGMFAFIPENHVCWNVHTCLLPTAYGPRARQTARELTQWIWENTTCVRVTTNVPDQNRLALMYAKQVGFKEFGINPKSYMKDGILQDQILLGISKPEATCPSQQ